MGARGSNDRADRRRAYECPYCHVTIYSTVESGNVKAAGHCGKQFRVRSGVVVRGFTHACPKCGQQIQSANPSGRIKHTQEARWKDMSQNKLGHQITTWPACGRWQRMRKGRTPSKSELKSVRSQPCLTVPKLQLRNRYTQYIHRSRQVSGP